MAYLSWNLTAGSKEYPISISNLGEAQSYEALVLKVS